ncbi:SGNH/GDSL hydrolase family protein [Spiroplasma endosymbiont of Aspidapion aeneum]|uniref:SGNH/GDSL hydrolase family protein n=1 Tax=Spiroplasma endosymbiont of Aspidapion aeneum TaxID=3066276 RepID=UPI00313ADB9B
MKKAIICLLSMVMVSPAITSTISCNRNVGNLDYLVGTDIKKIPDLKDDTIKNDLGLSNFYSLGDSLSDNGAALDAIPRKLTTILKYAATNENARKVIENIEPLLYEKIKSSGISERAFSSLLKLLISKMSGISIKVNFLTNNGAIIHNYCTDGETAVCYLAKKLNENVFNFAYSSNICGEDISAYGKNYSVAASTSAELDGIKGALLNDFSLKNQARALISQHNINSTDLAWVMIGGNDLFSILSGEDREKIIDSAMSNMKIALLTLMNNGFRHIVLANAPDISMIPQYINSAQKQLAHDISMEFNEGENILIDSLNKEYPNVITPFDLNTNFQKYIAKFKSEKSNANVQDPSIEKNLDTDALIKDLLVALINVDPSTVTLKVNIKQLKYVENPDNYLFWDDIHPREWLHKKIADEFYKIVKNIFKK